MHLTIDTSALIAVIGNEESQDQIVEITTGYSLFAPASVYWEIGNAFSVMFKRRKTSIESAMLALAAYQKIPITFIEIPLAQTLKLSHSLKYMLTMLILFNAHNKQVLHY